MAKKIVVYSANSSNRETLHVYTQQSTHILGN